jgi:hypothetical protein
LTESFVASTDFGTVNVNEPPPPDAAVENCTSLWVTWPYVASVSRIVWIGSATTCSCTLTLWPFRPLKMLTFASANPRGRSSSRTSAMCAECPFAIRTCHDVPPSKSMPKLSPRVNNARKLNAMSTPERIAHRLLCLMNWKLVRSW